jgi:hypothetical protein
MLSYDGNIAKLENYWKEICQQPDDEPEETPPINE